MTKSFFGRLIAPPEAKLNKFIHTALFGRRFVGDTSRRLLVLFEPNRISYASIFPFISYARAFRDRYDVEICCLPVESALNDGLHEGVSTATHVVAQTWLTDPISRHEKLERLYSGLPNEVAKAYLDSFSNCDIRLAGVFKSVDLYYKKSLFIDPSRFTSPTYGHTNLAEYYGHLYGIDDKMTNWDVPPSVLPKLRLAPNFLTDSDLSAALLAEDPKASFEKDIDLHARLGGTVGEGWYGEMRRHAARAVDQLSGLRVAKGAKVSRRVFAQELQRSKACFSPFGYGELCWRDIEAIAAGSVLIKPNMSHLRTVPDLYRDGETYVACRWDFADLPEKVSEIIGDRNKRLKLASNAKRIAKQYLESDGPVSAYSDLFQS